MLQNLRIALEEILKLFNYKNMRIVTTLRGKFTTLLDLTQNLGKMDIAEMFSQYY